MVEVKVKKSWKNVKKFFQTLFILKRVDTNGEKRSLDDDFVALRTSNNICK